MRNLVHDASCAHANPAAGGGPEQLGAGKPTHSPTQDVGETPEADGGCFFSLHPVESASGQLSELCVYVSTLCKERCNPSWSDIDHEDFRLARTHGWQHNRIGIRVWTATQRASGGQDTGPDAVHEEPSHRRTVPVPRMAPWERGRLILDCVDDADTGKNGDVGIGAEVPEWARNVGRNADAKGHRVGAAGDRRHCFKHGGLLGGGWIDSYRCSKREVAGGQGLDVSLSLEKVIVWASWVVMETPLAQVHAPVPQNALLLSLSDSNGWVNTYVDESDPAMAKLLKPAAAAAAAAVAEATAGTDSDSEAPSADAGNGSDASAERGAARAAADAAQREKEREERERRKEAEREKERQQRSMLLGHKDSRTPSSRVSQSAAHWANNALPSKGRAQIDAPREHAARDITEPMDAAGPKEGGEAQEGDDSGCESRGGVNAVSSAVYKGRSRAKALKASRQRVEAREQDVAAIKAKIEALIAVQAQRELERHRQNEMNLRLYQLRRRVQEEAAALDDLKMSVEAQERRLEKASDKDTDRASKTLRSRALTVLDTQAQRAKAAGEEAARRMGIDFVLPPPAAAEADAVAASSMEDAMARHAQAMSTERKILRELRRELKQRQQYLIASLHSTYPIFTAADGVTRTICGLVLPSPTALVGCDEEMLSTALGHTCHMVQLMAKYSCVCLRYEPIAMGSRSAMRDMTLSPSKTNLKDGNDFPLFAKGQDRGRLQVCWPAHAQIELC